MRTWTANAAPASVVITLRRRQLSVLKFVLSVSTVMVLLVGSAAAYADSEYGRSDDADQQVAFAQPVQLADDQPQQRRDADNERHEDRPHTFNLAAVVNALNAQVTELSTTLNGGSEDENDDDRASDTRRIAGVSAVSLATIVTRLSATDGAALTTAVTANTAALQAFLNGGTPAANAIVAALNAAGISPGSVLAILPAQDGELMVLLA